MLSIIGQHFDPIWTFLDDFALIFVKFQLSTVGELSHKIDLVSGKLEFCCGTFFVATVWYYSSKVRFCFQEKLTIFNPIPKNKKSYNYTPLKLITPLILIIPVLN